MKSACVGVLSIIELKNARWNSEILGWYLVQYLICFFIYNFESKKFANQITIETLVRSDFPAFEFSNIIVENHDSIELYLRFV